MNSPRHLQPVMEAKGLVKRYGQVTALDGDDFELLPGVVKVVSGFSGGTVPHPTYEQVLGERTGHLEAVQVTWDPTLSPSPSLGVTTAVMGNCGFGIVPSPPPVRDLLLLRLRALLARARNDEAAYADGRDRYRDMAAELGYEGHLGWAKVMP